MGNRRVEAPPKRQAKMVMWASANYSGQKVCVQNTMTSQSAATFNASMSRAFPGIQVTSTPLNSVPFQDSDNVFGLTPCAQSNLMDFDDMMSMGFDGDGSSMWKKRA